MIELGIAKSFTLVRTNSEGKHLLSTQTVKKQVFFRFRGTPTAPCLGMGFELFESF